MKSQNERLAEYLQHHETINPLQAWVELGIYRCGARIWELKHKLGMNIETRNIKVKNKFGESCTVAEYKLIK